MKQQFRRGTALTTLAVLVSAAALVACGGGDDPVPAAAPAAAPVTPAVTPPTATLFTAFATPSTASATTEGGFFDKYNYAQTAADQTITPPAFLSGAVTYSEVLSVGQGWAGLALRVSAPNNAAVGSSGTAFDASSFANLKIQLKTSNLADTTLKIMLQPSPVSTTGCAFFGTVNLTAGAALTEYTLPLTTASFALPTDSSCTGVTPPTLTAVKAGLFVIDVRNEANSNGSHDVTVGTVKLSN